MGGADGRHVEHCSVPERRKEGRERYSDIEAFWALWSDLARRFRGRNQARIQPLRYR